MKLALIVLLLIGLQGCAFAPMYISYPDACAQSSMNCGQCSLTAKEER
jgi:hypothetical protein